MESHHGQSAARPLLISTLKVDFHCSNDCPRAVKKRLQGFTGVESISVDPKRGLVTVLGKVNPMVLVKLIQKMGQRAELWSFQKAPMQDQSYSRTRATTKYCCQHHKHNHSESDSDTDSSEGDSPHAQSSKNTLYWENPLWKNGQKSKKHKGWRDRLGFGNYFVKPDSWIKSPRRPKNFPAPPPITTYMRYYRSTSPMYGRVAETQVSPYGRSSLMKRFINPMIHYRSYADNYR